MIVPIILFMQAFVAYSAHVHCAFGLSFRSFNLWAHFLSYDLALLAHRRSLVQARVTARGL